MVPYTTKHSRGKNFTVFMDCSNFTIETFPASQLENNYHDNHMVLLKYFKVEKRGPPLPDPSGLLNQRLSSPAIEKANKEVTAVLCDPGKRHPYLKISPEQKVIIARYAANHGIVKAVRQFSREVTERKYNTWMEEYLFERTFFAEKSW